MLSGLGESASVPQSAEATPSVSPKRPSPNWKLDAQARLWIGEKACIHCEVSLGHGTYRERKLHCQYCYHAICGNCADPSGTPSPTSRKSTCKVCAGLEVRKEEKKPPVPRLHLEDLTKDPEFLESEKAEELPHFDSLSDVPEVHYAEDTQLLNSVLQSAKQLIDQMASHSRPESDPVAQTVQTYNQQLKSRHSEVALLKEQAQWYSTQLTKRDAEINDLTYSLALLKNLNFDLKEKIKAMEAKLMPPRPTYQPGLCEPSCSQCHIL